MSKAKTSYKNQKRRLAPPSVPTAMMWLSLSVFFYYMAEQSTTVPFNLSFSERHLDALFSSIDLILTNALGSNAGFTILLAVGTGCLLYGILSLKEAMRITTFHFGPERQHECKIARGCFGHERYYINGQLAFKYWSLKRHVSREFEVYGQYLRADILPDGRVSLFSSVAGMCHLATGDRLRREEVQSEPTQADKVN